MFRWSSRVKETVPAVPVAGPTPAVSCPLLGPFLKRVRKLGPPQRLLLFGTLCGANVSFLGERGFSVRVEGTPTGAAAYEPVHAGALMWDFLSQIKPEIARQWVERIHAGLIEGGAVLAFFPPVGATAALPRTRYRILAEDRISPERVEVRTGPPAAYQNRDIIKLFSGFDLDLLHTHRTGQREVLFYKSR